MYKINRKSVDAAAERRISAKIVLSVASVKLLRKLSHRVRLQDRSHCFLFGVFGMFQKHYSRMYRCILCVFDVAFTSKSVKSSCLYKRVTALMAMVIIIYRKPLGLSQN